MNGQTIKDRARAAFDAHAITSHTGTAPWPELAPLPEAARPDPAPFPFAALGPILGPAGGAIADAVQAPDAIAGGAVLAAAAVAAQPHANVELPVGPICPLSLFIVSAAGSGDRKSAVDSVACHPIQQQRERDQRTHAEAMRQFKAEKASRKPGDPADDPPAARSLTVSKGTTEGLHHMLRTQPHVGLFSPEGAEVLGGHSLREDKRAGGIAWFLKAWSGEMLDNTTKGDGLSQLPGRRVSMHLMVQPVILRGLLADPLAQGQGLIARAMIAEPKSLAGSRLYRSNHVPPMRRPEVQRYHDALRTLLHRPVPLHPEGDGCELAPRTITLDPDAVALWVEFYDAVEQLQAEGQALAGVQAWASKAAEHAARIAGAITLLSDPDAAEVIGDTMAGAIEVANYYLGEHVRLMGQTAEWVRLTLLHDLLRWLQDRGPKVPKPDVLQRTPRKLRDLKADGINDLLGELEHRGYIRAAGEAWEVRRA